MPSASDKNDPGAAQPRGIPVAKGDSVYRLLIENILDYAIYMLSPEGVVSSWNPGAERFKGYHAEEIIGRNFSEFYTVEDRATGAPAQALRTAATLGKFESEGWPLLGACHH
jgi:PAS domain-containing protein